MKLNSAGIFAVLAMGTACASGASQAPRVASSAACEELGDTGHVMTALYEPGNVYSVQKAEEDLQIGRASVPTEMVGAELYLRAQPGIDQTYAERVLSCHATTRRAVHPNDPLVPNQGSVATVTVRAAGHGLAVRVVGSNQMAASEIWQRAQAFAGSGSVRVEQLASAQGTRQNF